MIPIFADKHYPSEAMSPEALDAYLAKGWYRMGQTIFTTHFLCFGRTFYSAIWVRLPLEGYQFSRSLRRIIRRNQNRFRTEFRQASITPEKEALYQQYKSTFPGMLAPTLRDSLLDGDDFNIYNTYEVAVYDGSKLAALSYFDLGANSAASITGIYSPEYNNFSLGIYTMLMEIAFCMDNQLDFFYPGYVVPGYPRFDYKLRIGDVSYFDLRTDSWLPFRTLDSENTPIHTMERRLQELQQFLLFQGIRCQKMYYPLFEANLFGFWHADYFDYPVFLLCSPPEKASNFRAVVFSPQDNAFQLLQTALFDDLQFYFNETYMDSFDKRFNFLEIMVIEQVIESSGSPGEIAEALKR